MLLGTAVFVWVWRRGGRVLNISRWGCQNTHTHTNTHSDENTTCMKTRTQQAHVLHPLQPQKNTHNHTLPPPHQSQTQPPTQTTPVPLPAHCVAQFVSTAETHHPVPPLSGPCHPHTSHAHQVTIESLGVGGSTFSICLPLLWIPVASVCLAIA